MNHQAYKDEMKTKYDEEKRWQKNKKKEENEEGKSVNSEILTMRIDQYMRFWFWNMIYIWDFESTFI